MGREHNAVSVCSVAEDSEKRRFVWIDEYKRHAMGGVVGGNSSCRRLRYGTVPYLVLLPIASRIACLANQGVVAKDEEQGHVMHEYFPS
jgi:hypothetical protein